MALYIVSHYLTSTSDIVLTVLLRIMNIVPTTCSLSFGLRVVTSQCVCYCYTKCIGRATKKMAVSVSPPLHPPPPPPLGLSTESDKTPAIVPASALQMQASDSKAAHLINGGCGHRWSHNYAVMVDLWTCSNLSCVCFSVA